MSYSDAKNAKYQHHSVWRSTYWGYEQGPNPATGEVIILTREFETSLLPHQLRDQEYPSKSVCKALDILFWSNYCEFSQKMVWEICDVLKYEEPELVKTLESNLNNVLSGSEQYRIIMVSILERIATGLSSKFLGAMDARIVVGKHFEQKSIRDLRKLLEKAQLALNDADYFLYEPNRPPIIGLADDGEEEFLDLPVEDQISRAQEALGRLQQVLDVIGAKLDVDFAPVKHQPNSSKCACA
jgi:hypothetical protein